MRNNYLTYNHLTRIKVEQGKPESLKKIFYSVGSLPVFIEAGVGLSFNHFTGLAENTHVSSLAKSHWILPDLYKTWSL